MIVLQEEFREKKRKGNQVKLHDDIDEQYQTKQEICCQTHKLVKMPQLATDFNCLC